MLKALVRLQPSFVTVCGLSTEFILVSKQLWLRRFLSFKMVDYDSFDCILA